MLIITRKAGESIQIGENIIIKILDHIRSTDEVRVAIEAPRNVKILRTELINYDNNNK